MQRGPAATVAESILAGAPATTLGEIAQAKIRCWMNLALISLALLAHQIQPTLSLLTIWYTFLFTAASAAILLLWARFVSKYPVDSRLRVWQRIASILLDNLSISWILYFGGETLAGVFSVYLWITIGYGMRFGLRYLFANLAASLAGFALVSSQSPFWNQYPSLALGLAMGLLVVPLYAAFLITQLHEAVRRAESASRAKGDFLAKMSHELRTPLHGIIALADLLGGTESPSQKQEMLRQISVSSNTLLDLINRILDISKFESGAFALQNEAMNLHAVLDDTISVLSPQARAKGVALSFFCDATLDNRVTGSPRQLQEVLINLGGNALKFTEQGSVRISMIGTSAGTDHVGVRIAIADTGPGIPKDYLHRIFDPFSQADDSITRQHGGTGLGTTIARDLVRLMGGDISIESELGVGTIVNVDLRLARIDAPATPATEYALKVVLVGGGESSSHLSRQLHELGVFEESWPRSSVQRAGFYKWISCRGLSCQGQWQ
jgi:two-component system sensor histidine kinase RpfC